MYYGALMDQHDPLLLRGPLTSADKAKHSWQHGGGHYYFYTQYEDATKMTVPQVGGFQITRVWDESPEIAKLFSKVFRGRPRVCKTFEEVSDDVDLVFIADCRGDGKDHLRLASPGLKKRVPTFIDKPFAYDVSDAQSLVALAKKHRTPLLSLSLLGTIPHAAYFRNRFPEIAPVEFGTVKGFARAGLAGQIHAISLAQQIFGTGVVDVECMGRAELGHVLLDYGGKPDRPTNGVVLNCDSGGGWHLSMYASAYSSRGAIHSPGISDFDFPYGAVEVLKKVRRMVQIGKPQVPYEEMIECIAVAMAARLAQKKRKRVCLADVIRYG